MLYLLLILLISLPITVFFSNFGLPVYYVTNGAPPGQLTYVMMRPAGEIAIILIFFQILIGSSRSMATKYFDKKEIMLLHKGIGLFALMFSLIHPLLFVCAKYLRGGKGVFKMLTPNFNSGYWDFMISIGVIALYLLIVAVLSAIIASSINFKFWRIIHCLNYLVFFLAIIHSIKIGSETRFWVMQILYFVMTITVITLIMVRTAMLLRKP